MSNGNKEQHKATEIDSPAGHSVVSNLSNGPTSQLPEKSAGVKKGSTRVVHRRIGIHGPRSAGKTCYLATAMYGHSTSDVATVFLADEESALILKQHWQELEHGNVPPATEATRLTSLCGRLVAAEEGPDGCKSPKFFETFDYGGRLVELGDAGVPELKQEVKDWIENADCMLLFVPVDQLQDPTEARERICEIDLLLARLLDTATTGMGIDKPIAIMVTKWDLVRPKLGDRETEQQYLEEFLNGQIPHDLGKILRQKVERAGERVAFFPVSTFGAHEDGNRPPATGPRPFNLHAPLVWVLTQSDVVLREKIQREVRRCLEGRWKDYRGAIKAYRTLLEEYRVQDPSAGSELRRLRVLQRRRLLVMWFAWVAMFVGMFLFAAFLIGQFNFHRTITTLHSAEKSIQEKRKAVQTYGNTWIALLLPTVLAPRPDEIKRCWEEVYQEYADTARKRAEQISKDWAALRTTYPSVHELNDFRDRCIAYLNEFQPIPEIDLTQSREQVKQILQQCQSEIDYERDYNHLIGILTSASVPLHEQRAALQKFLAEHLRDKHSAHKSRYDDLDRRLFEIEKNIDNMAWGEVLRYKSQNPEDLLGIREKVEEYLRRTDPPIGHEQEAKALREEIRNKIESENWRRVVEFLSRNPDAYEEQAEVLYKYIQDHSGEKYVQEAHKLLRKVIAMHITQLYKDFRKDALMISKCEDIERMIVKGGLLWKLVTYLDQYKAKYSNWMPVLTFEDDVRAWNKWAETLMEKRGYEISIVEYDAEGTYWSSPKLQWSIVIEKPHARETRNGRTDNLSSVPVFVLPDSTKWWNGRTVKGKEVVLSVYVELHMRDEPNLKIQVVEKGVINDLTYSSQSINLIQLFVKERGRLTFAGYDNKPITVVLQCEQLTPPALRPVEKAVEDHGP